MQPTTEPRQFLQLFSNRNETLARVGHGFMRRHDAETVTPGGRAQPALAPLMRPSVVEDLPELTDELLSKAKRGD